MRHGKSTKGLVDMTTYPVEDQTVSPFEQVRHALQEGGKSIGSTRTFTFWDAIDVLKKVDEGYLEAVTMYGIDKIGLAEQHREQLAELSGGMVSARRVEVLQGSEAEEFKRIMHNATKSEATQPSAPVELPTDPQDGIKPHIEKVSIEPATAETISEPADTLLIGDPSLWSAEQKLAFLKIADQRDETWGSLQRMLTQHGVKDKQYYYWKRIKRQLQEKAESKDQSAHAANGNGVATREPLASPASVAAPELPQDFRTWNAAQITLFVEYCKSRPQARGSLSPILKRYNVPGTNYQYWRRNPRTPEANPVTKTDPAPGESTVVEETKKSLQRKDFDPLDELANLPDVIDILAEEIGDPLLKHLANFLRARHAELLARKNTQPVEVLPTDLPVVIESVTENHVPPKHSLPDAFEDNGHPNSSIPIATSSSVIHSDIPLQETPVKKLVDDTATPEIRASLASRTLETIHSTQAPRVEPTPQEIEEQRRKSFVTAISLRIKGTILPWTYKEAFDHACRSFEDLPRHILEKYPDLEKATEVSHAKLLIRARHALKAMLNRYNGNRDGEIQQFLYRGMKQEILQYPTAIRDEEKDDEQEIAEHDPISREEKALEWAAGEGHIHVSDYFEFVGVMIKRHVRWVLTMAEQYGESSEVSVDILKTAGYERLIQEIKNFDFEDDTTYDSFKESIEGCIEEAIAAVAGTS